MPDPAFQKVFLDEKGNLSDDGKVIVSFFRDECGEYFGAGKW